MNRHLWKLEDVEGEGADEVTAVDEESSEDNEDPSYAFNLSPVFAPVTIKFYRSSELQQCIWPISRLVSKRLVVSRCYINVAETRIPPARLPLVILCPSFPFL
jgi:hypothetical protein